MKKDLIHKRFELTEDGKGVFDNFTRQVHLDMDGIVQKLNSTWNQTLTYDKYSQEYLETSNKYEEELEESNITIRQLQRENEILKEYINAIFDNRTHICNKLDIKDAKFYCEYKNEYVKKYYCRNYNCEEKCSQNPLYDDISLIDLYEEINRRIINK